MNKKNALKIFSGEYHFRFKWKSDLVGDTAQELRVSRKEVFVRAGAGGEEYEAYRNVNEGDEAIPNHVRRYCFETRVCANPACAKSGISGQFTRDCNGHVFYFCSPACMGIDASTYEEPRRESRRVILPQYARYSSARWRGQPLRKIDTSRLNPAHAVGRDMKEKPVRKREVPQEESPQQPALEVPLEAHHNPPPVVVEEVVVPADSRPLEDESAIVPPSDVLPETLPETTKPQVSEEVKASQVESLPDPPHNETKEKTVYLWGARQWHGEEKPKQVKPARQKSRYLWGSKAWSAQKSPKKKS